MIFHRMSSIFLYKRQKFSSAFLFLPENRRTLSFFSAQAERGARTAQAVRSIRAALFLHRKAGVRELPQAGSPLTGGKFFAEPQRGNSPSADGGSGAAPAAWAKRKDNLRFSFLFELLPFPYSLVWRRLPTCDRFETGVRQRIFTSVSFSAYSQCQIPCCYTDGLLYAGAT